MNSLPADPFTPSGFNCSALPEISTTFACPRSVSKLSSGRHRTATLKRGSMTAYLREEIGLVKAAPSRWWLRGLPDSKRDWLWKSHETVTWSKIQLFSVRKQMWNCLLQKKQMQPD
jgi:hypothetical protein